MNSDETRTLSSRDDSDRTPPLIAGERAAAARDQLPRRFGDYELIEEIARGGMGVVYKARQTKLDRIVALKMILAGQLASDEAITRFYTEAESAAKLDHPNIVPVFDVGEENGQHYFSMGYVDGKSLKDHLADGPLPPKQAAALMRTIAEAVQYAHDQGIVHRDLKPANVLLATEPGRAAPRPLPSTTIHESTTEQSAPDSQSPTLTPRITDFGLAKRIDADDSPTMSGQIMGTPSYMPPEQAQGDVDNIGPHSDVYSLGAVFYHLLTGRPPFQAASVADLLNQVIHNDPVPPSQLNASIDRDLDTICRRCLEKDAAKRPATSGQLASYLTDYLKGRPVPLRRVTAWERLMRWCQRNPMLARVGGVALALLLTLAIGGPWVAARQADLKNEAEQKGDEARRNLADFKIQKERADREATEAKRQRDEANRLLAQTYLDRGYAFCERGELSKGMLWFARGLELLSTVENVPEGQCPNLEYVLRANIAAWSVKFSQPYAWLKHSRVINTASFSPDGTTVITASDDHTAQLWEARSGGPKFEPLKHDGPVVAVAFSPDGKLVATASTDKTARLWDTRTGKAVGSPLRHSQPVVDVTFRPDGRTLLTRTRNAVQLWDAQTRTRIGKPLHDQTELTIAVFSPDSKWLLTAGKSNSVQLWDADSRKQSGTPLSHANSVKAAAFSPDCKSLVTATRGGTARLWSVASRKQTGMPMRHRDEISFVGFSPDGEFVLTGSDDKSAYRWDAETGKPVGFGDSMRHEHSVTSVGFNRDGKVMVTSSLDGTAKLWITFTGSQIGESLQHHSPVEFATLSPDGQLVLTVSNPRSGNRGEARIWKVASGIVPIRSFVHKSDVTAVAFSPDGRTVLTGTRDGIARMWNAQTGQPRPFRFKHKDRIKSVAFSPLGGNLVLTGSEDGTAQIWNADTGQPHGPALSHGGKVVSVAFSPYGMTVLTGSDDKTARFWDVKTGQPLGKPLHHDRPVNAVAFHPHGKSALTAVGVWLQTQGECRHWDIQSRRLIAKPLEHGALVASAVFSPDGRMILTGSSDRTLRLWNADTGEPLCEPIQPGERVWSVAFGSNGKLVANGGPGWNVRFWCVPKGEPVGPGLFHVGGANSLAFSPDGKLLLTGCGDDTARLWSVPQPIRGTVPHIVNWTQLLTGLELDDAGTFRELDSTAVQDRHRKLEALGGALE